MSNQPAVREGYVSAGSAMLYYRDIGQGQPIIVLHGGPDFDHHYFLPDMDRLADVFRLIYYDQRGRGMSGGHVQPDDVSMQSEVEDLERVRAYLQLDAVAVLGHSWGGVLAMEYALRHPERVSHLILMNTAPASRDDYLLFRQSRREQEPDTVEKLRALGSSAQYAAGDLDADLAYYRVHYRSTVKQPEHRERLIRNLRLGSTPESILKARAIEDRLMDETWMRNDYDLLPKLKWLSMPTMVLHGDHGYDLVPVECAEHIAQAIPGARLVVLSGCGHFSYLECPDGVRQAIGEFLHSA